MRKTKIAHHSNLVTNDTICEDLSVTFFVLACLGTRQIALECLRFLNCELAQSETTPCAERVHTLRGASHHLAKSESTPCPKRLDTLRRANLAQSEPTPCAEQANTSFCASRGTRAAQGGVSPRVLACASKGLALRKSEINSLGVLALFFFFRRLSLLTAKCTIL